MTKQVKTAPGQSLIQVRIGGRTYDATQDNKCMTCMHPARIEIEEKVLLGHSYRSISQTYSETEWTHADGSTTLLPRLHWESIYRHFKNDHLPIEAAVIREITDRRTQQLSQHYDEATARIVDGYAFSQEVLQLTHQRLVAGELQPDIKDGLAAAKLIKDIDEAAAGTPDTEAWSEAMGVYFEVAQQFMSAEAWASFCAALARNPILLAIQKRLTATEDVLDAEIVDEKGTTE